MLSSIDRASVFLLSPWSNVDQPAKTSWKKKKKKRKRKSRSLSLYPSQNSWSVSTWRKLFDRNEKVFIRSCLWLCSSPSILYQSSLCITDLFQRKENEPKFFHKQVQSSVCVSRQRKTSFMSKWSDELTEASPKSLQREVSAHRRVLSLRDGIALSNRRFVFDNRRLWSESSRGNYSIQSSRETSLSLSIRDERRQYILQDFVFFFVFHSSDFSRM